MNEYYVIFANGGFSYIYADEYKEEGRDWVFYKDDTTKGRIVAARWPKEDVKEIVKNPTFGE